LLLGVETEANDPDLPRAERVTIARAKNESKEDKKARKLAVKAERAVS
jgi:hypothetical protein